MTGLHACAGRIRQAANGGHGLVRVTPASSRCVDGSPPARRAVIGADAIASTNGVRRCSRAARRPELWASLLTLTALEIVLGIDNLIFLSIVSGRLPKQQQRLARQIGLALALLGRIALLFSLTWLIGLTSRCSRSLGFASPGATSS